MPAIGLEMLSEMLVRFSQPSRCGLRTIDADAVAVHGPSQLLRFAIEPNWLARQLRTRGDAFASSEFMPAATPGLAVAGLNTKARSFDNPSPLMSPSTTGVYSVPDTARPVTAIEKRSRTRV